MERRRSSLATKKTFDAGRVYESFRGPSTPALTQEQRQELVKETLQKRGSFFSKQDAHQILQSLNTDREKGLSEEEAAKRLQEVGKNELAKDPPTPLWRLFLAQFEDILVILLVIACIISFALQQFAAAACILVIVLCNAGLGVVMESRAGAAIEALEALSTAVVPILRDGKIKDISSALVVPGDIIILQTGAKIPADIRLIESRNLSCTEASLTGESKPVKKNALDVPPANLPSLNEEEKEAEKAEKTQQAPPEGGGKKEEKKEEKKALWGKKEDKQAPPKPLTDPNMVYMGCEILEGSGVGIVVKTGMSTKMGEVAALLKATTSDSTPLQDKLERLGVRLGLASIVISVVVFAVGLGTKRGGDPASKQPLWLQMLLIAVSLTVAAVPESLPAAVTIALAAGMSHMSKKNAWIRNLHSVETLGSASVICTDKTGTLTAGIQTAVRIWFNKQILHITGTGYTPKGYFLLPEDASNPKPAEKAQNAGPWQSVLVSGVLCSGDKTRLQCTVDPKTKEETWDCTGNTSEKPIVVAAAKANLTRDQLAQSYQVLAENPFDSTRKMMSTLVRVANKDKSVFGNAEFVVCIKGAPGVILDRCNSFLQDDGSTAELSGSELSAINDVVDGFSAKTFRVLAVAYRSLPEAPEQDSAEVLENGAFTLVGFIASVDPERPGVDHAIEVAADAGVRTIMITGDYIKTARAIGESIKLVPPNVSDEKCVDCAIFLGLGSRENELEAVEKRSAEQNAELKQVQSKIDDITKVADIYARAKPADKLTIVKSLLRQGHVAAMTGDGVNDAPALRAASIGVAMGKTGTEVARSAADMVLTDDNFVSIVDAIEEGRTIYNNIAKFVFYLLSTNIAEVFTLLIAVLAGYPAPLKPTQILWLNLVTDGLPAVALAVEKTEPGIMNEGPRPKEENIIEKVMITGMVVHNIVLVSIVLTGYIVALYWELGDWSAAIPAGMAEEVYKKKCEKATTVAILLICLCELGRAHTSRSLRNSLFTIGLVSNKYMLYATTPAMLCTLGITMIPGLRDVFGCEWLDGREWGLIVGCTFIPATVDEIVKTIYRLTGFGVRPKVNRIAVGAASSSSGAKSTAVAVQAEA